MCLLLYVFSVLFCPILDMDLIISFPQNANKTAECVADFCFKGN